MVIQKCKTIFLARLDVIFFCLEMRTLQNPVSLFRRYRRIKSNIFNLFRSALKIFFSLFFSYFLIACLIHFVIRIQIFYSKQCGGVTFLQLFYSTGYFRLFNVRARQGSLLRTENIFDTLHPRWAYSYSSGTLCMEFFLHSYLPGLLFSNGFTARRASPPKF